MAPVLSGVRLVRRAGPLAPLSLAEEVGLVLYLHCDLGQSRQRADARGARRRAALRIQEAAPGRKPGPRSGRTRPRRSAGLLGAIAPVNVAPRLVPPGFASGRRLITCYPFSLVHNAGTGISLPYDAMYARSETRSPTRTGSLPSGPHPDRCAAARLSSPSSRHIADITPGREEITNLSAGAPAHAMARGGLVCGVFIWAARRPPAAGGVPRDRPQCCQTQCCQTQCCQTQCRPGCRPSVPRAASGRRLYRPPPVRPGGAGGGAQAAGHVHRVHRQPRPAALPVGDHRQLRRRGTGRPRRPGRGHTARRRLGRGTRPRAAASPWTSSPRPGSPGWSW